MRKRIVLLLTLALLLSGCGEVPPAELLDEETVLTLALEEAREYVPLGLQEDSAILESDRETGLYVISFEPIPGSSGIPVTIVIDPSTGETVDVLLGN